MSLVLLNHLRDHTNIDFNFRLFQRRVPSNEQHRTRRRPNRLSLLGSRQVASLSLRLGKRDRSGNPSGSEGFLEPGWSQG